MMQSRFEWVEAKAASNLKKHGISFELAVRAFADPFALSEQDRIEGGEERWQTIGRVGGRVVLLVAHAVRDEGGEDEPALEIIRIVSARKADRKERIRYERQYG